MGRLARTDAIDAEMIARFGSAVRPQPRELPDEQGRGLRAPVSRRRQVTQMIVAERDRKMRAHLPVRGRIDRPIEFLMRELDEIEGELEELIKSSPP